MIRSDLKPPQSTSEQAMIKAGSMRVGENPAAWNPLIATANGIFTRMSIPHDQPLNLPTVPSKDLAERIKFNSSIRYLSYRKSRG